MDEEDRYTRITLRIPKELHGSLSEAAEKTAKSLNAEIVGRLQASFDSTFANSEKVAELEAQLAGSRYSADFVLKESFIQISLMARSNEVARAVSEDLLDGLNSALEIGGELMSSESRDPKKTEIELNNLERLLTESERRLAESRLQPMRDMSDALLSEAVKMETLAATKKAKSKPKP